MPRLEYSVELDSGEPEDDLVYLQTLQRLFRIITEELPGWGFTGDETISKSMITSVGERDMSQSDTALHSVRSDLH